MVNFVYLIGDRQTGEAVVVDPAYDPRRSSTRWRPTACASSARWPPTITPTTSAGTCWGHGIKGIRELLDVASVPIHVQADEAEWVQKATGVSTDEAATHTSGDNYGGHWGDRFSSISSGRHTPWTKPRLRPARKGTASPSSNWPTARSS